MFSEPARNVPYFELKDGEVVADFGAGSGAYALAMSDIIGDRGKIYALEVQSELVGRLEKLARDQHKRNIKVIWGNVEKSGGSKLADQSCDVVIMANLLFQSSARYSILVEAKRILRPTGRVVVIDWIESFNNLGPTPELAISLEEMKKIFAEAGFDLSHHFPAGDHHYGMIFTKQNK